ncbi:MAG: cyclase family protein [Candidatus Binataceae bacterium]
MASTEAIIQEAAKKYRNWGKWGPDDQLGTLNYITAGKVRDAARLVRAGKVISMALPYDSDGPQNGAWGRVNPVHTFVLTGADAIAGAQDMPHGIGAADDFIAMFLQCGTQWDALAHIYDNGKMWNGYSAAKVTSRGAELNGIERMTAKIVSRGVLLDIARYKKADYLKPGYAITEEDLNGCARAQGVEVRRGDIAIIRTGYLGHCRQHGWGTYSAGDAPGLSFHTAGWLHGREIAGIASDTWGVEVRPNELPGAFQPLHQVMIPNIGLLVGEIFDLEAIGADCAADQVYEFMFVAPPLPITGAVGTPVNPQAIK